MLSAAKIVAYNLRSSWMEEEFEAWMETYWRDWNLSQYRLAYHKSPMK
jgi:hypothetical protein